MNDFFLTLVGDVSISRAPGALKMLKGTDSPAGTLPTRSFDEVSIRGRDAQEHGPAISLKILGVDQR